MHLIDNAGQLWHRFWSLRFAALAAVLSGASVAATMALPEHTSLRVALLMGLLTAAASVASVLARLVKQPRAQEIVAARVQTAADAALAANAREWAIEEVRSLMEAHGLTEADIFGDPDGSH